MTSLDELIARAEVTEADFVSARKEVPFDSLKRQTDGTALRKKQVDHSNIEKCRTSSKLSTNVHNDL